MAGNQIYVTTGVGRFVQGDPWKANTTDQAGAPLTNRVGQPKVEFFIGVAFPKGPEWDACWAQIHAKAALDFPAGQYQSADFSWKIKDGDDPKFAGREGFAGCMIVQAKSGFPINIYDNSQPPAPLTDPTQCKRGDYVQLGLGIEGNAIMQAGVAGKPGIYVNVSILRRVAFGEAILSGPSPDQVFGAPAPLPPGGSATPTAAGQMPGAPPAPGAPPLPPAPPAPPMPPAPGAPPLPPMLGAPPMPGAPLAPPTPLAPPAGAAPPLPGTTPGFMTPPANPAPLAVPVGPQPTPAEIVAANANGYDWNGSAWVQTIPF